MRRSPCLEKAHTNKGAWTREEDERLIAYIRVHGEGCWRSLPKAAGLLRCGKSCRLRWINYLRPDLKRGNFTPEEDDHIIKLHSLVGNKWSLIAARLPGRTDNEIKNYWNTHMRRKLLKQKQQEVRLSTSTRCAVPEAKHEQAQRREERRESEPPDLNLDLSIRPPSCEDDGPAAGAKKAERWSCFSCRLGLLNSKECRCTNRFLTLGSPLWEDSGLELK